MQYILEETELTAHSNEPETPEPQPDISEPTTSPELEAAAPETKEQEETALVPTEPRQTWQEPEVVEGEVIELEPQTEPFDTPQLPKQQPCWLLIPLAIVLCLLYLAVSLLLPLLTPSATVLIIPTEQHISTTTTVQVHDRVLPALTLSQSQTTSATGKRHQDATQAHGTITFYNGLFTSQTIASGTILTGNDGVQVITNEPAIIPAATPPYIGQVTISAHALRVGEAGNIPAGDINEQCCVTAVKAVNTTAFTGGAAAREYVVVTRHDVASAEETIKSTLEKSERAALEAQGNTGESLTPPLCSEKITTDRKIGDEAREVRVTVSLTCTGIAYDAHDVYQNATQLITSQATTALGANYIPLGDIQVAIVHATITNQARGIATLRVKLDATYVYQLSQAQKRHISNLIAGKTSKLAHTLLLQEPGIAGVVITINGNASTLPDNPGKITIVIAERL